jgi:hypothetical protein
LNGRLEALMFCAQFERAGLYIREAVAALVVTFQRAGKARGRIRERDFGVWHDCA